MLIGAESNGGNTAGEIWRGLAGARIGCGKCVDLANPVRRPKGAGENLFRESGLRQLWPDQRAVRNRQCSCGDNAMSLIARRCDHGVDQNNHRNRAERVARCAVVCYSNQVSERQCCRLYAWEETESPRQVVASVVEQPQVSCPGHRAGKSGTSAPAGSAVIAEPPEQDL